MSSFRQNVASMQADRGVCAGMRAHLEAILTRLYYFSRPQYLRYVFVRVTRPSTPVLRSHNFSRHLVPAVQPRKSGESSLATAAQHLRPSSIAHASPLSPSRMTYLVLARYLTREARTGRKHRCARAPSPLSRLFCVTPEQTVARPFYQAHRIERVVWHRNFKKCILLTIHGRDEHGM